MTDEMAISTPHPARLRMGSGLSPREGSTILELALSDSHSEGARRMTATCANAPPDQALDPARGLPAARQVAGQPLRGKSDNAGSGAARYSSRREGVAAPCSTDVIVFVEERQRCATEYELLA